MLYHASPLKHLALLEPKPTLSNNKNIGDYLFATPNKIMAMMYLVPLGVPTLMNPDAEKPNIVIYSNKDEFKKVDKGGAIYELEGKGFTETPQKDLSQYEKVSKRLVKPISKTVYDSSLQAMSSTGIKIMFVTEKKFKELSGNLT